MAQITDKRLSLLARQIVKDENSVRVKSGSVNGEPVLHVFVPGSNELARDVRTVGDWEAHPANGKAKRNQDMADSQATEALMASNRPEKG